MNTAIYYLYAATPPLGLWCSYMRTLFKITQKGMKAYQSLSQDRIDRPEEICLLWQGIGYDKALTSAVASSEHLKRSFDTAVYLATIQLIQHWELCVKAWEIHKITSKGEQSQYTTRQDWSLLAFSGRPSITTRHLTSVETSSKHSKRSLNGAMFLSSSGVFM
jgi:hypothetical protein